MVKKSSKEMRIGMEAKELMIGDLVYFKKNKIYAKITEIYKTLDAEPKRMVALESYKGERYCVSIDENIRTIRIGDYVEGQEIETMNFVRGTLMGYALQDYTDPESVVAVVAKDHSHTNIHIIKGSLSLVSRYETLLRALQNSGLDYVDGKIVGRHVPKFCVGDIVRHKNYGELTYGNCRITYVSDNGYSYMYANGGGGGTFGFSGEKDYNLIKED